MAEAPVPDRPNTQSNGSPWLKVPGHADVLTRTMRGGCATWAAAQSSALRLSELASPTARWPFTKASGNDSRLSSLLGGVERKEHPTGITPSSIGSSNKRPQLPQVGVVSLGRRAKPPGKNPRISDMARATPRPLHCPRSRQRLNQKLLPSEPTQNSFWAGLQAPPKNRYWGVSTLKVMFASPVTLSTLPLNTPWIVDPMKDTSLFSVS